MVHQIKTMTITILNSSAFVPLMNKILRLTFCSDARQSETKTKKKPNKMYAVVRATCCQSHSFCRLSIMPNHRKVSQEAKLRKQDFCQQKLLNYFV